MNRFHVSLALACLCFFMAGCSPSLPQLEFDPKQGIELTADAIVVNGTRFEEQPTVDDLREIFGDEDRVEELANDIYVWDSIGVYVYVDTATTEVDDISISYVKTDYQFTPQSSYQNNIKVGDFVIGASINMRVMDAAGFDVDHDFQQCDKDIGPFSVYIDYENGLSGPTSISLAIEPDTE